MKRKDMLHPEFATTFRKLRAEKKLTQLEMAEELGIQRGAISNYENGSRMPEKPLLVKIANFFDVSLDYLITGSETQPTTPTLYKNPNPRFLPVLGTVSAGNLETPTELLDEQVEIPSFIKADPEKLLVVRCNGDSMNQIILDGYDIILIKTEYTTINNGDIVVFKTDNEYSVKRFYDMGDIIVFKPESSDESFKSIVIAKDIDKQIEIIGKALHVCMNLKKCDK